MDSEGSGSYNNCIHGYGLYSFNIWYDPLARFWHQRNGTWNSKNGRISGPNERKIHSGEHLQN